MPARIPVIRNGGTQEDETVDHMFSPFRLKLAKGVVDMIFVFFQIKIYHLVTALFRDSGKLLVEDH